MLGFPVVVNRASEKCIYVAGKKIIPTHCKRNQKLISSSSIDVLPIASAVNTITTQIKINRKIESLDDLESLQFEDVSLIGYNPYPSIKAEMVI